MQPTRPRPNRGGCSDCPHGRRTSWEIHDGQLGRKRKWLPRPFRRLQQGRQSAQPAVQARALPGTLRAPGTLRRRPVATRIAKWLVPHWRPVPAHPRFAARVAARIQPWVPKAGVAARVRAQPWVAALVAARFRRHPRVVARFAPKPRVAAGVAAGFAADVAAGDAAGIAARLRLEIAGIAAQVIPAEVAA